MSSSLSLCVDLISGLTGGASGGGPCHLSLAYVQNDRVYDLLALKEDDMVDLPVYEDRSGAVCVSRRARVLMCFVVVLKFVHVHVFCVHRQHTCPWLDASDRGVRGGGHGPAL